MGIVLKVKPEELKKKADSISASIQTVEKELNAIGTVILGTKKYWEGDASSQHQKYYQTIKEDIPTVVKRLKEHPKDLLDMADIYEETESANQQLSNKLPGNILV
ncbi:MAG: WXG100 family type VII secretion target [Roseburia sp.]|nr:WXG100 family type VII secretion target [Roseburia sp.]